MATLVPYALCTVDDVKESLGIASSDHSKDNLIIRKINMATEAIESFCNLSINHHFIQTTYTDEVYNGTGTDQLVLRMRPVTSVASFQYRNAADNTDTWDDVDNQNYFTNDIDAGVINNLFTLNNRFGSIRLTYTAGYATIPADLAEACASLAAFYVENGTSGGTVKRKREGQREIEYFPIQSQASGASGDSLIEQLNLDGILNRYVIYNV